MKSRVTEGVFQKCGKQEKRLEEKRINAEKKVRRKEVY